MEIKKINFKKEMMILKAIEKIFNDNRNKIVPKGEYSVTDPACVVLINAKSDDAKRILLRFLNVEEERENINIDYSTNNKEIQSSRYGMDYLKKIFEIFGYDEAVKMTIGKDKPITIENDDFKVILAPRIENE